MREATGISVVHGPLGSGKTYYAARRIVQAIVHGRPVATNVQLVEDWAERMAKRNPLRSKRAAVRKADELRRLMYFDPDPREILLRARLTAKKENAGMMVVDEAHHWLNSRTYAEEGRSEMTGRFSMMRKRGWELLLISQNLENIDKQVRNICTYEVRLVNWSRRYFLPFNLFLALHYFHGDPARKPARREVFMLEKSVARLYDTYALFGADADEPDDPRAVWLPRPPASETPPHGARPREREAEAGAGVPASDGSGQPKHEADSL